MLDLNPKEIVQEAFQQYALSSLLCDKFLKHPDPEKTCEDFLEAFKGIIEVIVPSAEELCQELPSNFNKNDVVMIRNEVHNKIKKELENFLQRQKNILIESIRVCLKNRE